jgi:hypothetical protein
MGEPMSRRISSAVSLLRRMSYVSVAPGTSRVRVVGSVAVVVTVRSSGGWLYA